MSDGPSKVVPEAEPLDDIILGDDDNTATDPPPPVHPKPSQPPPLRAASVRPPDRPSGVPPAGASAPPPPPPKRAGDGSSDPRVQAAEPGKDPRESSGKKRAKMTLRIPDDEVSRPNIPAATPVLGVPAIGAQPRPSPADYEEPPMTHTGPPPPGMETTFSADDTLELPQEETRARLHALTNEIAAKPAVAPGIDPSQERGWTPFQPEVGDPPALTPIQPTPIIDVNGEMADELESVEPIDDALHDDGDRTIVEQRAALYPTEETNHASPPSQPPISEEIPVDMDLSEVPDPSSEELETSPRLPISLDSEEIRIDDGDRVSETGETEVAPEDLVSVESLPSPAQQPPQPHQPPPVKTAGYYPAFTGEIEAARPKAGEGPWPRPPQEGAGPTATSLMQGVPPARPPVATPQAPPVATPQPGDVYHAQQPPHAPPPPGGNHHQGQHPGAAPPPAAPPGQQGTRKSPSGPLIFVPPVGALAPPAMTDAAAHRKKTRPWWEELFNDDFIRTMAKVTDVQIGKEVNFIEESLGCEAGAMILDLACGTGRHAVELAARGYQVVGFDLSLAMLARASDEAQDRKQKINFVQGDMREMTFEETFDGVYSWNTSFGYFDEEKNGAVIARVHKALKKGGQFLLDVVNRDYIIRQAPSLAWFEGDGCICMDEMTIDFITSRMKVKRTLMMDDGRTKEIEYSIRTYALHELGKMLHDNGFRVAEVSGRTGTPGVFFGCESPRTLILAEKR